MMFGHRIIFRSKSNSFFVCFCSESVTGFSSPGEGLLLLWKCVVKIYCRMVRYVAIERHMDKDDAFVEHNNTHVCDVSACVMLMMCFCLKIAVFDRWRIVYAILRFWYLVNDGWSASARGVGRYRSWCLWWWWWVAFLNRGASGEFNWSQPSSSA